ncbi:hypothetical protein EV201_2869 [Ancylomarina subtilis]|uniref:MG2 domain-containing protein n=1 Tax=Ancylomarina subtilis TaxID=1639035 RepID=A0A4Q7VAM1_9BACT|nr:hypothetical protein [Ancylomarina subtilis]RZT92393.1 hypothetical protein EV201_2869 [Ancylomarina subtilis]
MNNKISIYIFLILIAVHSINLQVKGETIKYASERIHVHILKNNYIAGEAIHFKLYCLNTEDQKLSRISKVAYVELIGENGYPVAQTDVILEHGMGEGGFITSTQIPTGNYAINAYTHWMKTSSPDFISVSSIFIFNNPITEDNKTPKTQFSCGAFRDLKNNDLIHLSSEKKEENILIKTKIEDLNRILRISIANNCIQINEPYKLQLFCRSGKTLEKKFQFNQQNWEVTLPIKDLKSSNYNISILDKENHLIRTAVIHIQKPHQGLFIEKPRITSSRREKIKLNLHLEDLSNHADSLFLSASIKLKEPYQSSINIIDYLNLYQDFSANMLPYYEKFNQVEKKSWIVENGPETLWLKNANLYTVNANRYPENEAYTIGGTVKNRRTQIPFANENIFLSKIGAYADINTFRTNAQGQFYFNLPLKKGLHDISIQVVNKNKLDLNIELKNKFNTRGVAPIPWDHHKLKGKYLAYLKQLYENQRIRDIYKQQTFCEIKDTCLYRGQENFYGETKYSIRADNYVQLDSLEEYFHEFIATVKIKYRKKKPHMYVFSPDAAHTFKQDPLILFDGLILSDASKILNKNSKEIDKIEIVPYEYYYGTSHLYGIISVTSKQKDCQLSELPKNTERYYLPLFTKDVEYLKAKENQPKHYADFRTDLLWEPNIKLTRDKDFNLEFISSDVEGEYELTVEGISEKGEPIVIKQSILIE